MKFDEISIFIEKHVISNSSVATLPNIQILYLGTKFQITWEKKH